MRETVTLTHQQVRQLAADAIGLYLEYHQRHGHGVVASKDAAIREVVDGAFADLPTPAEEAEMRAEGDAAEAARLRGEHDDVPL